MKRITLCADDYGQNYAISQAIIDLIKKNRLSATSCMTNTEQWLMQAPSLKACADTIDVGLHFNLTEGQSAVDPNNPLNSHTQLLRRAYLRQLDPTVIAAELNAQLDRFIDGMGREPDFIDGHQHIHQLPVVREAVLSVYEKRLRHKNSYIRSVVDVNFFRQLSWGNWLKSAVIQLTGAWALQKKLVRLNIPHNTSFAGVYDFFGKENYAEIFPGFLKNIDEKGLIMCHPGLAGSTDDVIAEARVKEYGYFLSDEFLECCERQQVVLSRFLSCHSRAGA